MHGGMVDEGSSYCIERLDKHWSRIDNEIIDAFYYDPSRVETHLVNDGDCNDKIWMDEMEEGHEYFFVLCHSNYNEHQMSGSANIKEQYSTDCKVHFGNMYACLNSRYDYANMIAAYALLDEGLNFTGAGKSGSIMPGHFDSYTEPMNDPDNLLGDAWKIWWQNDGIDCMSWTSAMVMEGVGTLRLRPYPDATKINNKIEHVAAPQVKFKQTASQASIFVPFNSSTEIVITNLLGKKVMSLMTNKSAWHTLPSKLATGVHFAQVTNKKEKSVYKFDVVR